MKQTKWRFACLALLSALIFAAPSQAQTELFFSEYIEGSSNNKALEIYNGTGAAINLATGSYDIQMYFNGSPTASTTIALTGTVANGDVYVLAQASANATILAQADQTSSASFYNGDDAVVLRKGGVIIDVIGQIGVDPGTEWGTGLTSTADNTLRRKVSIIAGDPNGADAFDPSIEWDGFATDTFGGLGSHTLEAAPSVAATTPTNGATNIAINTNLTITFNEPVNVTGSWFTISGSLSGSHTATASGGPTTFTLDPDVDFNNSETVTVTVVAANVTDQDANDPPDNIAADFSFSFTISVGDAAPSVSTTSPTNGATNVAITTNLTITFDEPVDVIGSWFTISGSLSGSHTATVTGGPTIFTLDPDVDFNNSETVTVTVVAANVTDQDTNDPPDNMAADFSFSFTISAGDAAPSVTSTSPTNGATNVAVAANLTITFDEPVNVTGSWFTISGSLSGAHTATVSGGPTVFTLDPDVDFNNSETITVTVLAANVTDQDANDPPDNMTADFPFSFTTIAGDAAPSVSSTVPTNGAISVEINANLTITFSEAVNVTGSWFDISGATSGSHTATVSGGPTIFTLNPNVDFAFNELVTVNVFAANVTDQDANDPPDNMAADYTFSFTTPTILINEILADPHATNGDANGDGTVNTTQDEFIEFVNVSGAALDISGWTISDIVQVRHTFAAGTIFTNQCGAVVFGGGTPTGTFGNTLVQVANASGNSLGLNNTGDTITLKNGATVIATYTYGSEGGSDQSLTRNPDITGPTPLVQHTTATGAAGRLHSPGLRVDGTQFSGCASLVTLKEIYEIQGNGLASPFANQTVTTENNVVTAVGSNGFFIQTPTARSDPDAQTSDGIFVFTSSVPTVGVGDFVNVTGNVVEFFNFTEYSNNPTVTFVSSGNPLPAPVQLDNMTPTPNQPQSATEYERFEGMRVQIANGVVTSGNQTFGTDPIAEVHVVAGANRPFRETGIEYPGLPGLPVWDGNPEIFEFDPDRLGQPNLTIPAGSTLSATGVLGFEFGDYEFWPTSYSVNTATLPRAVRSRNAGESTIATLNVLQLFDDVDDPGIGEPVKTPQQYADKLNKLSMYIRTLLGAPNILALQEVEKLPVLQALADKINSDDASLTYTPYLLEGNDVGGIDVGFLVRSEVTVNAVTQLGATEIFTFDGTLLHDRPPLLLEANLADGCAVSVLVVHLRSLIDIDDPSNGPRVRQKRNDQAVSVSNMVQSFQTANPNINLVVTGDFNAFQFTDGYVHVLGQIMGTPADASQALVPGTDNVNPDLTNAVLSLPASEQYSFVFEGSAQILDHMLVSQMLQAAVTGIEYARANSDAAANLEADGTTVLRTSDHDGLVLFVTPNTVVADAGADKNICAGLSASIGGSPTGSGGTGPYTYLWSPATGLDDATIANPAASPTTTTIYTVEVRDAKNCKMTDQVTIAVNPLPTATVSGDAPICASGSASISIALTGAAPWNLTWSDGFTQNDVASSPATRSVSPAATTSYTVTNLTDANICSNTGAGSATITVNPLPTASISGNDPIVTGTTHTYTSTTDASSPSYSWNVTGGTINGSNIGSTVSVTAGGVGTMVINLSVTDGVTSCSNSAAKNVTVNPNTFMVSAGDDAAICIGAAANLNGAATGGSGTYTFAWTVQSGPNTSTSQFNDATLEDPVFTPTLAGSYTLRLTADDGVVAPTSDEVIITVNALPTASIAGPDPVNSGSTSTYTSTTDASSPSYLWSVTNGTINGSNNGNSVSLTAGAVGTMAVNLEVTDGTTGCKNTATKNVNVTAGCALTVNAGADRNVLYALTTTLGGSPTVSGGTPPYTYNWTPTAGLDNPALANPKAIVTSTTTYVVNVTDANGCSGSDQVIVTVLSYVLMSDGYLKINQNKNSKGDIHANNKIEFQTGAPGTHVGNLTATSDLTIQTKNTIQGNATVGGDIYLFGSATITGAKQDHATVPIVPLPSFTYSAGGANVSVPANGVRILAPGSYGTVKVNAKGTLLLFAGNYFINTLDAMASSTILSINAGAGAVNIYVVNSLLIGPSLQVKLTGGTSDKVLIVTLQTVKLTVGSKAVLHGTLVLPKAQVQFSNNSAIKGAVYASSISLDSQVKFYHHTSLGTFAKASGESEVEESEAASGQLSVVSYQLEQNYPNPFSQIPRFAGNPTTVISFQLPVSGEVTLSIFNTNGQLVKKLVAGEMNAGRHSFTWDATNDRGERVASGVYLYVIKAGEFTAQKKLVLMK